MNVTAADSFIAPNRKAWRNWLKKNHASKTFVWLIYHKKNSTSPSIKYSEAVDEALCFGWIDSTSKPIDEERYQQYFCKRKEKSVWSKINKEKVERLITEGLMTEAGYQSIDIAKKNGSWTILDEVEALVIPEDLSSSLGKYPVAIAYFNSLSRSDKRNMLQWLVLAKQAATRQKRIEEIVTQAKLERKPKQFMPIKR